MYQTSTITATATDGSNVTLVVPTEVPSNDRADYLRKLYNDHVEHPDGHWKGRATALVVPELANDVAEAMDFMGSLVDESITLPSGRVRLNSAGYWAHGF